MIYVGPEETVCSAENLTVKLASDQVMQRSALEIDAVCDLIAKLEETLISKMALCDDAQTREVLQSVDLVQQSLNAIAHFLNTAAQENVGGEVCVRKALAGVRLRDMRNRLGK